MYSKELVDAIWHMAENQDLRISISRGRNLVSLLLIGRPYSQAIAAHRAGNSLPPNMDAGRIAGLRHQHGPIVNDLVRVIKAHMR